MLEIGFVQKCIFYDQKLKKSHCGGTLFCLNSSIQYSGITNLLPKKFDRYLNTILYDFLETFDSCHIAAAVTLFIFFVNIG